MAKPWRWSALRWCRLPQADLPLVFAVRCNVAVVAGPCYGDLTGFHLNVLDCDDRESLDRHLTEFQERGWPLWAVESARGGHLYFLTREPLVKPKKGIFSGFEVRTDGYTLAPPSVHPDGPIYQWSRRDTPAPPAIDPHCIDWLLDRDGQPVSCASVADATPHPPSAAGATTRLPCQRPHLIEGTRNTRLFAAACDLAGTATASQRRRPTETDCQQRTAGQSDYHHTRSAYSQPRTPAVKGARGSTLRPNCASPKPTSGRKSPTNGFHCTGRIGSRRRV
jgi:hypothetical protein